MENQDQESIPVFGAIQKAIKMSPKLKRCQSCGELLDEDSNYCEVCGAPVILKCPNCGKEVGYGKNFCKYCGTDLEQE